MSLWAPLTHAALDMAPTSATDDITKEILKPTLQGTCKATSACSSGRETLKTKADAYYKEKGSFEVAQNTGSNAQTDAHDFQATNLGKMTAAETSLAKQMDDIAETALKAAEESRREAATAESPEVEAELKKNAEELDKQAEEAKKIADNHRVKAAKAGTGQVESLTKKNGLDSVTPDSGAGKPGISETPTVPDSTPVARSGPEKVTPAKKISDETAQSAPAPTAEETAPRDVAKVEDKTASKTGGEARSDAPTATDESAASLTKETDQLSRPLPEPTKAPEVTDSATGAVKDFFEGPKAPELKDTIAAGDSIGNKGGDLKSTDPSSHGHHPSGEDIGGGGKSEKVANGRSLADSTENAGRDSVLASDTNQNYDQPKDIGDQNSPKPKSSGNFASNFFQDLVGDNSAEEQVAELPPFEESFDPPPTDRGAPPEKNSDSGKSKFAQDKTEKKSSSGDSSEKEELAQTARPNAVSSEDNQQQIVAAPQGYEEPSNNSKEKISTEKLVANEIATQEPVGDSLISEEKEIKNLAKVEKQDASKTASTGTAPQLVGAPEGDTSALAKPSIRESLKNRLMAMMGLGKSNASNEAVAKSSKEENDKIEEAQVAQTSQSTSRTISSSGGSRVEQFSMNPLETEKAVINMLNEAGSMGEILGIESKGLFQRVRSAHLRFSKKI